MNDSPVKKLNFEAAGKENAPVSDTVVDATAMPVAEKPAEPSKAQLKIREIEANEPLLQENPHRFVLFPIKYHEVSAPCHASRVKWDFFPYRLTNVAH